MKTGNLSLTSNILIESINSLRTEPSSFSKKFLTISKALQRTKKIEQGKELESIAKTVISEDIKPFQVSDGLCFIADKIARELANRGDEENLTYDKKSFDDLINKYFQNANDVYYLIDYGDLDNITTRILISDLDPQRKNKSVIFSEKYNFIGAASKMLGEDDISVLIFAKDLKEKIKTEEFSDLKEMFDTLDERDTGYIDPFEIYDKLLESEFDLRNPTLVELFKRLSDMCLKNKKKKVDFDEFKETAIRLHVPKPIKTRSDWKNVFNLFVDDVEANCITIYNIRRIIKFLKEDYTNADIKKFMRWLTENGNEMNFAEFYEVMTTKLPGITTTS